MALSLTQSYRTARGIARSRARNFYFGISLLPRERRDALCAIYAFMRRADDIADGPGSVEDRRLCLAEWHEILDRTLSKDFSGDPICPALYDAVTKYNIRAEYFHELIRGTEMDLAIPSYHTFEDLYQYCYRVASVVGLCSLHVFGFTDPAAKELAEQCGIAFQLTNILRDVREDAANRRLYLPQVDLKRFGVLPEEIAAGNADEKFVELIRFEAARARGYYQRSYPLIGMVEPESRAALWTIITIYGRLLAKIEADPTEVQRRRVSLSGFEKSRCAARGAAMMCKMRLGLTAGGVRDWQALG